MQPAVREPAKHKDKHFQRGVIVQAWFAFAFACVARCLMLGSSTQRRRQTVGGVVFSRSAVETELSWPAGPRLGWQCAARSKQAWPSMMSCVRGRSKEPSCWQSPVVLLAVCSQCVWYARRVSRTR